MWRMGRRQYLRLTGGGGVLSVAGCVGNAGPDDDPEVTSETLTLAAGTTLHDSGLLPELTSGFQQRFGARVDGLVQGSGGALRTARNGDCDVVLVHARPLEDEFLRAGHGINRRAVMVNDFLLVGPPDDPAGVAGKAPVGAFEAIADAEAAFLSRGDRSGTHLRERLLWDEAGIEPTGAWYRETGQGMGGTLFVAGEIGAYTLADRATVRTVATDALSTHVSGGVDDPPPLLRNEYAVIPVDPARHDVAYSLAMAFVGYVTGPGRTRIEAFRVAGERVFRPVRAAEPRFEQYVPRDWR